MEELNKKRKKGESFKTDSFSTPETSFYVNTHQITYL